LQVLVPRETLRRVKRKVATYEAADRAAEERERAVVVPTSKKGYRNGKKIVPGCRIGWHTDAKECARAQENDRMIQRRCLKCHRGNAVSKGARWFRCTWCSAENTLR
jgi:hypothetical protein